MALGSLIVGSLSALAPKFFSIWENRQDNKQELAMLEAQLRSAEKTEAIRMDITAIEGAEASYQASLRHDTAAGSVKANTWLGRYLFDFMAVWRSSIRPGIVTTFMVMYCIVKYSQCADLTGSGMPLLEAIGQVWNYQDWAMLELTVGYYFTNRGIEKYSGKT